MLSNRKMLQSQELNFDSEELGLDLLLTTFYL